MSLSFVLGRRPHYFKLMQGLGCCEYGRKGASCPLILRLIMGIPNAPESFKYDSHSDGVDGRARETEVEKVKKISSSGPYMLRLRIQ